MKTRLVAKLSLVLMALLAIVLYKTNDYFKDEKFGLAQLQVHNRVIGLKTSIASQLSQLKNILSSYETEINESKINWVQLAPFFVLADVQVDGAQKVKVMHVYGRSGSSAQSWDKNYLEKALNLNKTNFQPDAVIQLFRDKAGGKFVALNFRSRGNSRLVVAGPADYFQKYFDLDRGGRFTTGLLTENNIIAAHSEADYVASLSEERKISTEKYLAEFEEIAGTNLTVMTYALKKNITAGWSIPWSVIGLIVGFGFVFMAILSYGLDPLEKRIERYRSDEKKLIFERTLGDITSSTTADPPHLAESSMTSVSSTASESTIQSMKEAAVMPLTSSDQEYSVKANEETSSETITSLRERIELKARELVPTNEELTEATLVGPLQQAIFNMDRPLKLARISISKNITSNKTYEIPYKSLTRAFEEVLRLIIATSVTPDSEEKSKKVKLLIVHLTDQGDSSSVVEFISSTLTDSGLNYEQIGQLFEKVSGEVLFDKNPHGFKISYIVTKEKRKAKNMETKIDFQSSLGPLKQNELKDVEIIEEVAAVATDRNPDPDLKLNSDLELDLDQILSLEENSKEFAPEHTKIIENDPVDEITQVVGVLKAKEKSSQGFQAPKMILNKKKYDVDELEIAVRRPEKC